MVDPFAFAMAQKLTSVKFLFDNNFKSIWKTIELSTLDPYIREHVVEILCS